MAESTTFSISSTVPVNQTLKAQLDLERHGARKPDGVWARMCQRLLALTAAIWHNETANQPGPSSSLTA